MNSKIAVSLVVCGTLCILATLGISAYLVKQLSPMLATDGHIRDNHMLLVGVASVPGVATFIVGVILLVAGLKRSVGRGDMKGNE
jgi:integral membrane sensor domain MASE1